MPTCKLFAFVFIMCFAVTRTSAGISLAKTLQSQDYYKDSQIYFDHESQKRGILLYMLCHRSSQNMLCTIFREQHYVDKLPRISPCNVTFKIEDPYVRISERVRLLLLNPTKALILWAEIGEFGSGLFEFGEKSLLKYTIVDFDTCKTTETTLKTSDVPTLNPVIPLFYPDGETIVKSVGFAFYDDSCVISFHDFRCGTDFCKIRIDKYTGKVTSEAEFWYSNGPETIDIVPKNPQDSNGGNFFINWKDGVIYKFGENQNLVRFPTDRYHIDWQNFRYSVRDNFITVCKEIEETKVKCDQIDYDGKITIHTTFNLYKRNVAPVPYSLRGGGFLLLTTECTSNCTERATNHVYKVEKYGKLSKAVDIESFNCSVDKFTHWHKFFESEQRELCISLLCYDKKKTDRTYKTGFLADSPEYIYINTPEELQVQCLSMSVF